MPDQDKATSDAVAGQIHENLRRIFATPVQTDIPEHFESLLQLMRDQDTTE